MKRIRILNQQERALWAYVARSVKSARRSALKPETSMADLLDVPPLLMPSSPIADDRVLLPDVATAIYPQEGLPVKEKQKQPAKRSAPAIPYPAIPSLAPIERGLRRKLNRGKAGVDAKIDLHGLRQDEAHNALTGFINRCSKRGDALVLVVTGKGGRKSNNSEFDNYETGILRRMVPLWLGDASMRAQVIGFEEAANNHGGAGALYVRLRRLKS